VHRWTHQNLLTLLLLPSLLLHRVQHLFNNFHRVRSFANNEQQQQHHRRRQLLLQLEEQVVLVVLR
jgi:hypothetical protein